MTDQIRKHMEELLELSYHQENKHRCNALADCHADMETLLTEGRDRETTIDWWRERYNNLVSVMSVAVDGGVVEVSDDATEYPLSDGAKALLARIAALDPASGKQR